MILSGSAKELGDLGPLKQWGTSGSRSERASTISDHHHRERVSSVSSQRGYSSLRGSRADSLRSSSNEDVLKRSTSNLSLSMHVNDHMQMLDAIVSTSHLGTDHISEIGDYHTLDHHQAYTSRRQLQRC